MTPTPVNAPWAPQVRANSYAWIAGWVCAGLLVVLAVGLLDLPGLGLFSQGTAMAMIGGALTVLTFGLVGALLETRKALRAMQGYAEVMAVQASRHAEELAAAAANKAKEHEDALEALAQFDSRQASAIASLEAAEMKTGDSVSKLSAAEDQLERKLNTNREAVELEVDALRSAEQDLEARIKADEAEERASKERFQNSLNAARAASRREVDRVAEAESELASRVGRTEGKTKKAIAELEAERGRLLRTANKVLGEERERKEEFEALAGEEIRLLGRVRRTEEELRGKPRDESEQYRIARPRSKEKGPFGEIYSVSELEGMSTARATRLREIGIEDTEQLWRARPAFVAKALHVEPEAVERWQEEAELMAIHGIGPKRARALVDAGVNSLEKLGRRKPAELVTLVEKTHPRSGRAIISAENAKNWIDEAHSLESA